MDEDTALFIAYVVLLDRHFKRIIVDHQLQRTRNMQYIIEDPKTSCGVRMVPMTSEVAECFRRILANRKKPKIEPMIAGYRQKYAWIYQIIASYRD